MGRAECQNRCSTRREKLSSGRGLTLLSRSHLLCRGESLVLHLAHQELCASLRSPRQMDRIPLTVGCDAGPVVQRWEAPRSASLSAASLPSIPVCLGAHLIPMLWVCITPWQLRKAHCEELGRA